MTSMIFLVLQNLCFQLEMMGRWPKKKNNKTQEPGLKGLDSSVTHGGSVRFAFYFLFSILLNEEIFIGVLSSQY